MQVGKGTYDSVSHHPLSWWYDRRWGTGGQEVDGRLSQTREQYADEAASEKAQAAIAQDPECQLAFADIAKFAKRISRELAIDLDH